MNKQEILEALDRIYEMNDKEITMNADFIKEVANKAYGLIKQKYKRK